MKRLSKFANIIFTVISLDTVISYMKQLLNILILLTFLQLYQIKYVPKRIYIFCCFSDNFHIVFDGNTFVRSDSIPTIGLAL